MDRDRFARSGSSVVAESRAATLFTKKNKQDHDERLSMLGSLRANQKMPKSNLKGGDKPYPQGLVGWIQFLSASRREASEHIGTKRRTRTL